MFYWQSSLLDILKTRTVNCAIWQHWNDLEMQRKNEKEDNKWCIFMVFKPIKNCRENVKNKDAYTCIMTLFQTIFKTAMTRTVHILTQSMGRGGSRPATPLELLKPRTVNAAFWRFLKRYFGNPETILKSMKLIGAFWRV